MKRKLEMDTPAAGTAPTVKPELRRALEIGNTRDALPKGPEPLAREAPRVPPDTGKPRDEAAAGAAWAKYHVQLELDKQSRRRQSKLAGAGVGGLVVMGLFAVGGGRIVLGVFAAALASYISWYVRRR